MGKHRLLIIEDDAHIAELVRQIGEEVGFEARVSLKAKDIVPTYTEFQPEAIVLDVMMPDTDGIDVINFLRDYWSTAQIVILSGSDPYRDVAARLGEAGGLHIAASLAKPFRKHELRLALQEVLFLLRDAKEWESTAGDAA